MNSKKDNGPPEWQGVVAGMTPAQRIRRGSNIRLVWAYSMLGISIIQGMFSDTEGGDRSLLMTFYMLFIVGALLRALAHVVVALDALNTATEEDTPDLVEDERISRDELISYAGCALRILRATLLYGAAGLAIVVYLRDLFW